MANLTAVDNPRAAVRNPVAVLVGLGAGAGLLLAWLGDLESSSGLWGTRYLWWETTFAGPIALAWLLSTRRHSVVLRAGLLGAASVVVTVLTRLGATGRGSWSLTETVCLLFILVRLVRTGQPVRRTVWISALVSLAVIGAPLRSAGDTIQVAFLLTFPTAGAVGAGAYLRALDTRRAQAVTEVRRTERLQLARDLHDLVAHHITGIVVQAQAAQTIHTQAPEQIQPILADIERAGLETLESMRQLVRVLRTERPDQPRRPGDLLAELASLTAGYSRNGGPGAGLVVGSQVRALHLSEPMRATVVRVVQEGLTNAQRHAAGNPAQVDVQLHGHELSVQVSNPVPPTRPVAPIGGHGGYGLIGLRERVEAVGGTLQAGPSNDRHWWVVAILPTSPPHN
jgi:signal transduction histidine kinase